MSEEGWRASRAFEPISEGPEAGWNRWLLTFNGTFLDAIGQARFRATGERTALVRIDTGPAQANLAQALHGGWLTAFADHALFLCVRALRPVEIGDAVTLDLSMQFLGAGRVGEEVEAEIELVHETGRMIFLRGIVRQGAARERTVASFNGTLRKVQRGR